VPIATISPAESDGFSHPFPTLAVTLAVNVGGGNVGTVPVGVYEGKTLAANAVGEPALMTAGGHTKEAVTVPAPAPPVCHALRGGVQGSAFWQTPYAVRGSVGIQPCWRPS